MTNSRTTITIYRPLLQSLLDLATTRDAAGLLGDCGDHVNGEGCCTVCTTLANVQLLLLADDPPGVTDVG